MGTNFYRIKIVDGEQTEGQHIGKRSAAGKYCHDCNVTLNIHGNFWVHQNIDHHYSSARNLPPSEGFNLYARDKSEKLPGLFPKRYKAKNVGGIDGLSEMIKEGESNWFLKCPICGKEVKTTTCSFTWAIPPYDLHKLNNFNEEPVVIDEYGQTYNFLQFDKELQENKIHYYHSIGDEFC